MSHSWSNRLIMLWNKSRKIGGDSLLLLTNFVKSPSRDVLLRQAREANSVAVSLLRAEREVNLVRYHGVFGYLREKNMGQLFWQSSAFSSGAHPQDKEERKTAPSNTKARVAFMITASQRTELSEKLGYSTNQIKQLKPVEAALILEHGLQPHDVDEKLPELVKAYHSSLSVEEKDVEETKSTSEEIESPASLAAQEVEIKDENNSQASLSSTENTRLWHEVVEVKPSSIQVIGLFQSESEAQLLQETKEDLRAKFEPDETVSFQVRKTWK